MWPRLQTLQRPLLSGLLFSLLFTGAAMAQCPDGDADGDGFCDGVDTCPTLTGFDRPASDFSNLDGLSLNGDAAQSGTELQLTNENADFQSGSAYLNALPFDGGESFSAYFRARITASGGSNSGADGMAFVMHNDGAGAGATGQSGNQVGFGGLSNSIAVVYDTYGQFGGINEVRVAINGDANSNLASANPNPVDLNGGATFYNWIDYDAQTQTLEVFISTLDAKPQQPLLTVNQDLNALFGGQAFIGFTAATGGLRQSHFVSQWQLNVTQRDQTDSDGDGVGDLCDNCPAAPNADQADSNDNAQGDACEDRDGDGLVDADDNCPDTIILDADRPDFSDVSGLVFSGNSALAGTVARLTTADGDFQAGGMFIGDATAVDATTSFSTHFRARIHGGGASNNGADGMAFVMHNDGAGAGATGQSGDQVGFGGLSNSIAVVYDTYGQFGGINEVRVAINGDANSNLASANPNPVDLNGGATFYNWIDYDAQTQTLEVFISTLDAKPQQPLLTVNQDLNALFGGQAFIGFTAATGGLHQNHDVERWALTVNSTDQTDGDGDGVGDLCDLCPAVADADQADEDGDDIGDACDLCPGDVVNDPDGDAVCALTDNCPAIANAGQDDTDGDDIGDACDACALDATNDSDGDGVCQDVDNCPTVSNADQADDNADGFGDACVSPDADIDPTVILGEGITVSADATIGSYTRIGDGATINGAVGDSAVIGDGVVLGAGASVGNAARIGDNSGLGAGCTVGVLAEIGMGVSAGANCVVGSQATVSDGVVLSDGVHVGVLSQVGPNTQLGAGCVLNDNSQVGADGQAAPGCIIEGNALVGDAFFFGANTRVEANATVGNAVELADDAVIGPYSVIGDEVTVGAQSVFAAGSSAGLRSVIGAACEIRGMLGQEVTLRDNVFIGNQSAVGDACTLDDNVSLGLFVNLGARCALAEDVALYDGVSVGPDSDIGARSNMLFYTTVGANAVVGVDTVIDERITIGDGFTIGDNSRLWPFSTLGDGVTIGDGVLLRDSAQLGNGVTIENDAIVFPSASIGPDTTIQAGVELGNADCSRRTCGQVTIGGCLTIGADLPPEANVAGNCNGRIAIVSGDDVAGSNYGSGRAMTYIDDLQGFDLTVYGDYPGARDLGLLYNELDQYDVIVFPQYQGQDTEIEGHTEDAFNRDLLEAWVYAGGALYMGVYDDGGGTESAFAPAGFSVSSTDNTTVGVLVNATPLLSTPNDIEDSFLQAFSWETLSTLPNDAANARTFVTKNGHTVLSDFELGDGYVMINLVPIDTDFPGWNGLEQRFGLAAEFYENLITYLNGR
ncbi:MAG: lectin-like domain-containing protein [Bradymonadia bacterium]